MAAVQSLGVHTPVALPYLIHEGLLPQNPKSDHYQWETYVVQDDDGPEIEEEVLATKNAVVWSQGRFIRKIYRFNLEGEDVLQALLTTFSPSSARTPNEGESGSNGSLRLRNSLGAGQSVANNICENVIQKSPARALVVLLKTRAQVYFLRGSSHIIDLPFEVEKAFAAPRGLLLQRKRSDQHSFPPTPQIPVAPPNSFFSSQGLPNSSLRHSFSPALVRSLAKDSFAARKPAQPTPPAGSTKLEALFQDVIATPRRRSEDDLANLYTLCDPFSDLGVITYSLQHYKPRTSTKGRTGLSVEFERLDPAEHVIYVSRENEIAFAFSRNAQPLTLLVTYNSETNTLTIWHAWYLEQSSLQMLLKLRADHKAAKARRRSSFLSTNMGTGAATPAVRRRDATRESLAAPGQVQAELAGPPNNPTSRKPTKQEEEEAMASQMDPDYQLAKPQQTVRDNRRISSMNADVRASQTTVSASFAATGGRRATSFGGTQSRRSLSHRKSRGSTPGSAYTQGLGGDEGSMDLDSTTEFDSDETLDEVLRHIRATFETSDVDSVFGNMEKDFKHEIVVRKLHSFPVDVASLSQESPSSPASAYTVVTLAERPPLCTVEESRLSLYIHDKRSGDVRFATMKVRRKPLWPEHPQVLQVPIPLYVDEGRSERCDDILKLCDGKANAVLSGRNAVFFTPASHDLCRIPRSNAYRVHDTHSFLFSGGPRDTDIGRNRLLDPPKSPVALSHAGPQNIYDEISADGTHHRRRLKLRPRSEAIEKLLCMCEAILPHVQTHQLRQQWCIVHAWIDAHPEIVKNTESSTEVVAFVTSVMAFALPVLDSKTRAALTLSKIATVSAGARKTGNLRLQKAAHERQLLSSAAWSWSMPRRSTVSARSPKAEEKPKDHLIVISAALANELSSPAEQTADSNESATLCVVRLMLGFHVMREECKLSTASNSTSFLDQLAPVIAQLGMWLALEDWTTGQGTYYGSEGAEHNRWAYVNFRPRSSPRMELLEKPIGVYQWFEHSLRHSSDEQYPTLATIARIGDETSTYPISDEAAADFTPRIVALSTLLSATNGLTMIASRTVELLEASSFTMQILDSLPEAIAAPIKDAITRCEKDPPTLWTKNLLQLVGREDLTARGKGPTSSAFRLQSNVPGVTRDVHTACAALEHVPLHAKTKEVARHEISQLIFSEDRRLVEATSLMHFNSVQIAQCPRQPDWDEAMHFEQMRRVMHWVTIRMIALPAGDAMIHYDSQTPLLTERYHLPGFNSACLMQPMGHTMTTDRSGLTEEKVNWAYFHAGVSAGLRISQNVKGIDTSWIAFNKPAELTNRHAGLLLALGLGGHLRKLAKWLSFKYLTAKHTMTSTGLLLGLSASYLGTMNGLITRMLSVHITRMLPPGAAELNVTPATQTAGLMGIGLLYHNTQHRRMSEIMLSEIEYMEPEDPDNGPDILRDESYRLAAGFALGFINLGKGNNSGGLHGMRMPERLLAIAVGPRAVSAVHVFDRATAGAVMAAALVFMKTGDATIARKIDIPDTEAQYEHVRPDILMLRAMAKHLILWDDIEARGESKAGLPGWIQENLPPFYKNRADALMETVITKRTIDSAHIPMLNVFTGLAWALGLKYAGSGNPQARWEILNLLDFYHALSEKADAYYFDSKLGRASLRRCMDVLALCAAMIMAGTGDLETFRYLRRMHGRTDPDTPYGSHLAAHLAIGTLFLGGGTFTFSTSDLAIASLMCAFYPLFPTDVHDNRVHLQAFRHLWVLAAESRCIAFEDIDTRRLIHMPIKVIMRDGSTQEMKAPCLLPELDSIATVHTDDPAYWRVTLDFAGNPEHLASFREDQRVCVRRCPAAEAHDSIFSAALAALSDALKTQTTNQQMWSSLFELPAFQDLDRADMELVLPPEMHSSMYTDERGTVVDEKLSFSKATRSFKRDALWNLRILFAWAEKCRREDEGSMKWIGLEVVDALKAKIEERSRA